MLGKATSGQTIGEVREMTKVINLFGGSGMGKSTTAAGVFYELKMRGVHCEMVREYVKQWAWDGTKVGPFDQVYLFGKQAKCESRLYGKVDVVVTDSPLLLSPIYEMFYSGRSIVLPSALAFMDHAKAQGVHHLNFMLERHKPFDTRGRYETEETARRVDSAVVERLGQWGIKYDTVGVPDRDRVEHIVKAVLG